MIELSVLLIFISSVLIVLTGLAPGPKAPPLRLRKRVHVGPLRPAVRPYDWEIDE